MNEKELSEKQIRRLKQRTIDEYPDLSAREQQPNVGQHHAIHHNLRHGKLQSMP